MIMSQRNKNLPANEPPRVGDTLAALRQAGSLSLDELSRKAGVSKSMLSQIERGQANPTVAVVWQRANALDGRMGELLGNGPAETEAGIEIQAAHGAPQRSARRRTCPNHSRLHPPSQPPRTTDGPSRGGAPLPRRPPRCRPEGDLHGGEPLPSLEHHAGSCGELAEEPSSIDAWAHDIGAAFTDDSHENAAIRTNETAHRRQGVAQ